MALKDQERFWRVLVCLKAWWWLGINANDMLLYVGSPITKRRIRIARRSLQGYKKSKGSQGSKDY